MKIFNVGGSVRDIMINRIHKPCREINDFDFVVVGSTPEEMIGQGFKQVGAEFPIFLHPENGNEHALARTERKVGTGHTGFTCEWQGVTLEEDLSRRDLTINAMATNSSLELIDPFNGLQDIKDKVLRHVSPAFAEDPLRVLRLFRLRSQLGNDWTIHPSTLELCINLAASGELKTLTPERVWKEAEKALSSAHPSSFFDGLKFTGLFPEFNAMVNVPQKTPHHPEIWVDVHTCMVMDWAAERTNDAEVVFAGLCHDMGKPVTFAEFGNALGHEHQGVAVVEAFCDKWKVPSSFRDLAVMTCRDHTKVHSALGRGKNGGLKAKTIMNLFDLNRALTHTERFCQFLTACEADAKGRGGDFANRDYKQAEFIFECLTACIKVDTAPIAAKAIAKGKKGEQIGEAVRSARIQAIEAVKDSWDIR